MSRLKTRRGRLSVVVLTATVAISGWATPRATATADDLPSRLTDQEFWRLTVDLSEPEGRFPSDNLLSNELTFAQVIPDLTARAQPGGVFVGVGPEQNFTYIAALKSRLAFITDIRRGNLQLQLMYKALFELSSDRADFLSRLFTKRRPSGLSPASSVGALMDAFWTTATSDEAVYAANLKAIIDLLTKTHALPVPAHDLDGISRVYRAFYWYGPAMNPGSDLSLATSGVGRSGPTYRDVVVQADGQGHGLSFLGSEEQFGIVQALQRRNLVIPIVGNFSGPTAIRAIGRYVRSHGATVNAFYLSNVESYLRRDGSWPAFCANVAAMPLDEASLFVRVRFLSITWYQNGVTKPNNPSEAALVPILEETKRCGQSATSH